MMENEKELDEGKICAKWEEPYRIQEALGKSAYKLLDEQGREIP